jgi:hypothetical protein
LICFFISTYFKKKVFIRIKVFYFKTKNNRQKNPYIYCTIKSESKTWAKNLFWNGKSLSVIEPKTIDSK